MEKAGSNKHRATNECFNRRLYQTQLCLTLIIMITNCLVFGFFKYNTQNEEFQIFELIIITQGTKNLLMAM